MISDNFLLRVTDDRVSIAFQQRIYVTDSHVPCASSHTAPIYVTDSDVPCALSHTAPIYVTDNHVPCASSHTAPICSSVSHPVYRIFCV
jgi:hypothetical protein